MMPLRSQLVDAARYSRTIDITVLIVLSSLAYRGLITSEVNLAGDWPYFFDSYILDYLSWPYSWLHLYMGGYALYDLYRYPVRLAQASLTHFLHMDYSWTVRSLFFFPFLLLGPLSMYCLASILFKRRVISFIATCYYMLNSFILWRVVIGNPLMAVSYALLPLVLLLFIKGVRDDRIIFGMASGLILGISMYYDLRISLLSLGAVMSYSLYDLLTTMSRRSGGKFKRFCRSVIHLIATVGSCVILHLYWVFPAFLAPNPMPIASSGYDQPFWVDTLSFSTMTQTLRMTHWYWLSDLGKGWSSSYWAWFWPTTTVAAVLVFLSVLLRPRDSRVLYLSVLGLASVFLSKGSKPPFGEVYIWLFQYFPGFEAFREPLKFMFITPLFFSMLYGLVTDEIVERLRGIRHRRLASIGQRTTFVGAIFILLVIASPIISNQIGLLHSEEIPEDYSKINDWIKTQPDGRIFWVPYLPSYITMNQKHPTLASPSLSTFGSYYPSISFQELFLRNDTRNIAKILGPSNVRYVLVYPPDEPNWMYFPNGSVFYRQILDRQLGLRKEHTDCGIDVYENQFFLPRFYGAKYGALIVGPRDTLETLAYEVNFSDWAVFFADQMKTDVLKLLDDLDAVVFFPGRDLDDLTLATVNESYRIDLWNYARPLGGNSEGAWIRDMWWIYDYPTEIPESGSGWLVSAGRPIFETNTATMKIHFKTENTGLHDLWLRVGFGQDRGLLSLSLDHSLIFEERLSSSSHEGLKWIKLGSVWMSEGDHVITVSSRDGMNSLDELVVMPHDKITSLRNTLENRLSTKKVITFNNTRNKPTPSSLVQRHYISNLDATGKEGSRTQIEMQRIDPTKYVLRINLTIDRTFIIFSEAYNPSWQMSTRDYRLRPIIAYGGINCFILKSEGEVTAELEFLPQTYLNAGTYITVFGSVVIVSYIVAELLFSRITRILKMRKTTVQS